MSKEMNKKILGIARITMGWVFFWAFIDKTFGLGYATSPEKSWLSGNSPTSGFLSHTDGTFASIFQAMAGVSIVDWLFMVGLLLIGLALILGIAMNLAVISGSIMMLLMYLASVPLDNNPIIDDHIINILILLILLEANAGRNLGLQNWWHSKAIIKKYYILK